MEYGKKTENHGKWETSTWRLEKWRIHWKTWIMRNHTVGPGIWLENWKSRKMRKTQFRTWNVARKTEKGGKFRNVHCKTWNMAKNWKSRKMRNTHFRTWNMARKTETHGKWETSSWGLEKWRIHWKTWKMRNAHCRTWNMARKLKITENEKNTL